MRRKKSFSRRWNFWLRVGVAFLLGTLPAGATNVMRVMTFNLRYASAADGDNNWVNPSQSPDRRQVVVWVLTNRAPDIVGFQEGEDGQIDYLAQNAPGYAFEKRKPSGGSGNENAAFAWKTNRLDLLDRGVFSLGTAPGGSYWNNPPGTNFNPYAYFPGLALGFPRIALWGRFRWKPTGQEFLFYTTHLDFNDEPQVRSALLINDDARARNARMPASPLTIVVGDFNSSHLNRDWNFFTGSFSTNGVTGDFKDSWYHLYFSWFSSGTFHGFAGGTPSEDQRIDWILHRGGFTSQYAQVLYDSVVANNARTQYPSDHYPVMADLKLPEPPADFDRDGLPDAMEMLSSNSLPADADSDNDGLVDGLEDLDGDGIVSGGETDPSQFNAAAQNPTDIRNFFMDGVRDHPATLLASNGMDLYARFDGRYLYVCTQDAGEGNDHFIFISTNPTQAVAAPWAKSGQVGRWLAYLADENDSDFTGWFDASGSLITNRFLARAATYFQNGGRLEGVLDLGQILAPGFTQALYLAVAPFGTSDGGVLASSSQVPAGNGDGNLLGASEYFRFDPGDADGDGINDTADPDADGDGLPDVWAKSFGLSGGSEADADGDGASNRHELESCTNPTDPNSVFKVSVSNDWTLVWPVSNGKTATLWQAAGPAFSATGPWQCIATGTAAGSFPSSNSVRSITPTAGFFRVIQSP